MSINNQEDHRITFSKEALEHEILQMREQLRWAARNFYKNPEGDESLVWLERYLFWKTQIENLQEMAHNAPSENREQTKKAIEAERP
jgi:hypothetical protein